ncbi:MAG: hypothetical protein NTZ94_06625, partial [Verrucomicrobia bacterium]|nr:hypothetical protein [Verrucomicrobiota bacterium]
MGYGKDIRELLVGEPPVGTHRFVLHLGNDRVSPADGKQRQRTKKKQDVNEIEPLVFHDLAPFGHAHKSAGGATMASTPKSGQCRTPFITKVATKSNAGMTPVRHLRPVLIAMEK